MSGSQDIHQVLQVIYQGLKDLCPTMAACSVQVVAEEKGDGISYQISERRVHEIYAGPVAGTPVEECWREQRIIYRPDLKHEDPYGEAELIWDETVGYSSAVRSVLDVPFSQGTLGVNSPEPNAFSQEDIEILQATAEVLSEGFRRMKDLQNLEKRNQEVEETNRQLQQEIVQRQQSEEALRESEKRYRSLLESISDSVYVLDREFRHVVVNDAAERFVQIPKEKLLGGKLTDLFPEVEETGFFKVFQQVMESRNPDVVTDEYIFVDGRKGWYEVHVYPVPEGILCISRDITERKQAEEALRESETNYREIFDNATDMVFIQDTETGAILDVNATTLEKTGYTYEELINMGVEGFSPKGNLYSKERITQIIEKVVQGKPQLYEWGYIDKAGEFHPTEVSLRLADIGEKNTFLELHATSPNASRQRRC